MRVASVEAVAQVDCGLCRREGYAAGDYVVEAADGGGGNVVVEGYCRETRMIISRLWDA